MSPSELKLKVSGGLFFLAAIHAVTMAMVLMLGMPQHHPQTHAPSDRTANYFPTNDPLDEVFYKPIASSAPIVVNQEAQDELKRSILEQPKEQCINCPPAPAMRPIVNQQPIVINQQPTLAPPLPGTVVTQPSTVTTSQPAPLTAQQSNSGKATGNPKKYQLLIFYDASETSKEIMRWLNEDPRFINMRRGSSVTSVQYYTKDNALYKTRFAKAIPPDQFPVILLTDSAGGHIHAAGGNFMPRTSEQLYADMAKGLEMYEQVKQQAPAQGLVGSGAMKTFGYSFSPAVYPTMRLEQQDPEQDCPDGRCPPVQPPNDDNFDEGQPDGRLFPLFRNKDPKSIVTWASGGEYAMVIGALFLGLVIMVLLLILFRRLSK